MAKDIRIELLQDRENVRIGSIKIGNSEFSNSSGWTSPTGSCADAFTFTGGLMQKAVTSDCARATISANFYEGNEYEVKVAVKNYNRVGKLLLANHGVGGANVTLLDSTIVPAGGAGTGSSYGFYTTRWVQGASNTDNLQVYANAGTELDLTYIRPYRTAVDKSSVYGVLEASTSDDFPMALTFSVNDPSNIDARKGAFSKTFQIPATKQNNTVLKHFAIPNSTLMDAQIYNKIPCRITVGNMYAITGLLQVQDVERLNDKPILYSCIFLGDNLAWSTLMEGKYLSDLQLNNSTNLVLDAENVTKSWYSDNATSTTDRSGTTTTNTSPVVYPPVSYGRVNETGYDYGNGFQLYRRTWEIKYMNNVSYNTSETGYNDLQVGWSGYPVVDWRPLVWIYNMMHQIFNDVGYKISSNFMETDNFKRLLYASPNFLFNNPNERKQNNMYIGNFKDSSCAASQTNLKFFDITGNWTFNVTQTSQTTTYSNTAQNPYQAIQFGGTCGSGVGSGRFQPASGVITTSAGHQQELLVSLAGSGTAGDPYYNMWTINENGYYKITTQNIMYYFNWGVGDWTGAGAITNNSVTGITIFANLVTEVRRVGGSTWEAIDQIDNDSGTELAGFKDAKHSNMPYSFGGTLPAREKTFYFNKGDNIRITFGIAPKVKVSNPQFNFASSGGQTNLNVRTELFGTTYTDWQNNSAGNPTGLVTIEMVNEDQPAWGSTYNLQDIFPKDQKQIDFVKGVAHAFNLQFYTQESSKTVFIEPYNDFYLPPKDAVDWSHKLARNQSDVQSFIQSNFTRRLVFKYKTDDKDWRVNRMSETYFDNLGDNYPKQVELPDTYPAGTTVFENPFFAGTYDSQNWGAGGLETYNQNNYTASLWTADEWYNSPKGYEFKPRLLYYNKMTMPSAHTPLWQGFRVQDGSWNALQTWNFQNQRVQTADVTTHAQSTYSPASPNETNAFYCSATFIDRHSYTNQFGLSYGNYWAKDYDPATNTYTASGDQVGHGLYERYYRPMVEGLQARPKLRVCYIDLRLKDIIQLNFRRMVYIDGVYYRISKIVDYQPHTNGLTKVELHQWSPSSGSAVPTTGVWINPTGVELPTGGGSDDPAPDNPNQGA
jgi:hypothetical protein